jgi:hypothetical protein
VSHKINSIFVLKLAKPGAGLPPGLLDVFVGEDADQDAERDDGAVGDLHERCDERREAEAFDDYGAEVGDACGGEMILVWLEKED